MREASKGCSPEIQISIQNIHKDSFRNLLRLQVLVDITGPFVFTLTPSLRQYPKWQSVHRAKTISS